MFKCGCRIMNEKFKAKSLYYVKVKRSFQCPEQSQDKENPFYKSLREI
jgi:hypothetical protein